METERNRATVCRYLEQVWGRGDIDVARSLVHAAYIDHTPPRDTPSDREGLFELIATFRTAFPDTSIEIHDLIAERDLVADRWTVRGTHLGPFFGLSPTGRSFTLTGMDIHRVVDGKLFEAWHIEDILGMIRQLGP